MVFKIDKELQEIVKETIAAYEQFEILNDARILVLYCDSDKKEPGKTGVCRYQKNERAL